MQKTRDRLPFVVQEHHEGTVVHWDLMLLRSGACSHPSNQDERVLATWKLSILPTPENLRQPLSALALPDHRRAYLIYEGPIRGDRGSCRIVDRGDYEILEERTDFLLVYFSGQTLIGRFILRKTRDPDQWILAHSE